MIIIIFEHFMGKDYRLNEMICDSTRYTNELIQINNIRKAIRNLRNKRRFGTTTLESTNKELLTAVKADVKRRVTLGFRFIKYVCIIILRCTHICVYLSIQILKNVSPPPTKVVTLLIYHHRNV